MRSARQSHWRLLATLLRPQRRRLAVLGLVLALSAMLPLAGPQLLRSFIDAAIDGAGLAALTLIAVSYVLLGVGAQLGAVATTYAANRVAWTTTNQLREDALRHVLALDLEFHRGATPGVLIERVDGDATEIARFFTDFAVKVAGGVVMLLGAVALVAREDWRVGIAVAVFVAAALSVIVRLRDHAVPATTAERRSRAEVFGQVEERLAGAEDLRALGAGGYAVQRLLEASGRNLHHAVKSHQAYGAMWGTITALFAAGAVGMLLAGAWLHARGSITLGTVFLLFSYTQVLRQPIEELTEHLQQVQKAAAGAARIADLMGTRSGLRPGGEEILPAGPLPLRFRDVGFSYGDDDVPVLHRIDLEVTPGTSVGLIGRTGSGKSTLARLALRLADPTAGTISLGGIDLRVVDPQSLRERIALVSQDVQLFSGTVRDNLTLFETFAAGRLEPSLLEPHAGDETMAQVLHRVGLGTWFSDLPDGLDTVLGTRGAGLSAGQAQLLGFARVFLRDPSLVVLDEASSRVDPATQAMVEAATTELLADRTGIVIAHRLSSVLLTDHVVVLEAGRIVEHGPTAELAGDPGSRLARMLNEEQAPGHADGEAGLEPLPEHIQAEVTR